MPRPIEFLICI